MQKLDLTPQNMRGLVWKQPFAELMLHGKIETRTWKTSYRGWVLICAALKPYNFSQIHSISGLTQGNRIMEMKKDFKNYSGMAIGIGELVECRPMKKEDEQACYVDYFADLYCHVYENVKEIEPFKIKGAQGWMRITPEIINKIQIL